MTKAEFLDRFVNGQRAELVEAILSRAVDGWVNEGKEEIVRVLTLWATRDPYQGGWPVLQLTPAPASHDHQMLLELAAYYGLISDGGN